MRDVLSWAFPIGQLFGIMIRVHFAMPIFILGIIGRQWMSGPTNSWQDAAWLMLFLFISVLLHEFGHCFAARFMDGESDEVLLWPLGGLAFCRSLPNTALAHFIFALGGPLVNVGLCILGALALSFAFDCVPPLNPFWNPYRESSQSIAVLLPSWDGLRDPRVENLLTISVARFFWINWILLLFNLLPGIPFDGGRILQAALWPRLGHYQATKIAIYAGFVIMMLVGLWSIIDKEPLMAFLTVFIFMSCAQELMVLESAHEDSLFGYDFSQGYTSLEKDEPPPPKPKKQNFIQRWLAQRAAKKQQQEQEQRKADDLRMDELLEKIQKFGKNSLTDEEQRFLRRVADRYKNK
jgi:Zn-dependent protease